MRRLGKAGFSEVSTPVSSQRQTEGEDTEPKQGRQADIKLEF